MHNVVPFPDYMSAFDVRRSAERGTRLAIKLRDEAPEQRFRYPQAIFILAMREGYRAAADHALALAIGTHTPAEAMAYVRKVFAEGKAEIKDRAG